MMIDGYISLVYQTQTFSVVEKSNDVENTHAGSQRGCAAMTDALISGVSDTLAINPLEMGLQPMTGEDCQVILIVIMIMSYTIVPNEG
jgi:hypothetical protein